MLAVSTGLMTTLLAVPEFRKQMRGELEYPITLEVILIPAMVMLDTVLSFSVWSRLRFSRDLEDRLKAPRNRIKAPMGEIAARPNSKPEP